MVALSTFFTLGCSTVASNIRPADVAAYQPAASKDPDSFIQKIQAEYKHREEVQKEFLSATCELAEKTDDAEAREICKMMNANAVTYMPIGSNIVTFDKRNMKQPVPLLIVEGNEFDEFPNLKEMDAKINGVGYLIQGKPFPLMIVKNKEKTSKTWKAILILHEGMHVKQYYSLPSNAPPQTAKEIALDEVRAYEFEERLLDKLGGKKYTSLVIRQITRFERNKAPMSKKELDDEERKINAVFDDVFKPSGDLERRYLWYEFNLELIFRYIDSHSPDKKIADSVKATVYLDLHRSGATK